MQERVSDVSQKDLGESSIRRVSTISVLSHFPGCDSPKNKLLLRADFTTPGPSPPQTKKSLIAALLGEKNRLCWWPITWISVDELIIHILVY